MGRIRRHLSTGVCEAGASRPDSGTLALPNSPATPDPLRPRIRAAHLPSSPLPAGSSPTVNILPCGLDAAFCSAAASLDCGKPEAGTPTSGDTCVSGAEHGGLGGKATPQGNTPHVLTGTARLKDNRCRQGCETPGPSCWGAVTRSSHLESSLMARSSVVHNSPEVETSVSRRADEPSMVPPYSGLCFSHKGERTRTGHMGEPWEHHVKWKPATQTHVPTYDLLHMQVQRGKSREG